MRAVPWLVIIVTVIATQIICHNLGLAWWRAGCSLMMLGLAGHFADLWLTFRHTRKTMPWMAFVDRAPSSEFPRPWELTARTEMVPSWVSWLAFVAYGCLLSGALFLIATMVLFYRRLATTPL